MMSTKTNFGDVDVAAGSITAEEIGSGAAPAGYGLTADGVGGAAWAAAAAATIAAGSAGAPGLAVAGDANTGLFAPAADVLAVATGGVERVSISGDNRVRLGTITVGASYGNSSDAIIQQKNLAAAYGNHALLQDSGGYTAINAASGAEIVLSIAGTAKVTVSSVGNVGIKLTPVSSAALLLPAGTTAIAPLKITTGVAPTTPNDGDIWIASGAIYVRLGGVTKSFVLA